VKAVIVDLLNDAAARDGMVRGFWSDRMIMLDTEPLLLNQFPDAVRPLLKPAFDLDTARLVARGGRMAQAAAAPDWPAAAVLIPPPADGDRPNVSRLEALAHVPSRTLAISGRYTLLAHFRRLGDRRMAAVALAVRLYRVDHDGAWPASLDDLVPGCLPAVPADPFAAGGRPLRYKVDAPTADGRGTEPAVYSVGEDGVDDGGSWQPDPDLARRHRQPAVRWQRVDAVWPLTRNPETRPAEPPAEDDGSGGGTSPAPAPSPASTTSPAGSGEAQNDQPDQGDGGGKDDQRQDGQ
jgi:hypothetical protein